MRKIKHRAERDRRDSFVNTIGGQGSAESACFKNNVQFSECYVLKRKTWKDKINALYGHVAYKSTHYSW